MCPIDILRDSSPPGGPSFPLPFAQTSHLKGSPTSHPHQKSEPHFSSSPFLTPIRIHQRLLFLPLQLLSQLSPTLPFHSSSLAGGSIISPLDSGSGLIPSHTLLKAIFHTGHH